jgi:methionine synthase II (cobalamin-independent)
LNAGLKLIHDKADARGIRIMPEEFKNRSLISPSCGMGPTTTEIADRIFDVLYKTGKILRQ